MAENNTNGKIYYSQSSVIGRNKPLDEMSIAVSGSFKRVVKRTSKKGDEYLDVTFESVLGDKMVEGIFGKEYLNAEHKVDFRFPVTGYAKENFEKYPPRWGQNIVLHASGMKTGSYQRKDGTTEHEVRCLGEVLALGSVKDPKTGEDRKPVTVFDATGNASAESGVNVPEPGNDFRELEPDEEVMFPF